MRYANFEIDFYGNPLRLNSGSTIMRERDESSPHKVSLHDGYARFDRDGEISGSVDFRCLKVEARNCTVTVYSFDKDELFPLAPEKALGWVLSKLPIDMSAEFFRAVEQNAFEDGMVVSKLKMQNALKDIIGIE